MIASSMSIVQDGWCWLIATIQLSEKMVRKGKREVKACYGSLPKHRMKRKVVTDKRGIQVNPVKLAFLSQDIDPLHPLLPLRIGFECILTPLHLGIARHFPKVHILLEVVSLPVADPLVEMPMNFREQISDGQDPLEVEPSARQAGVVKLDAETPVQRAFDDQRTLLFFGDGSTPSPYFGDADVYWRLRYVTMDLALIKV